MYKTVWALAILWSTWIVVVTTGMQQPTYWFQKVAALWVLCNAAVILASKAMQHSDFMLQCLCKDHNGHRAGWARMFLQPMAVLQTLGMRLATAHHAPCVRLPGTNVWVGSLPRVVVLDSECVVPAQAFVIDCATEVTSGRVPRALKTIQLPCLPGSLPEAVAISVACRDLRGGRSPVFVGSMQGTQRAAAVASVVAAALYPHVFPDWHAALAALQTVLPQACVHRDHHDVLDAALCHLRE
jgi:hypothetical protein